MEALDATDIEEPAAAQLRARAILFGLAVVLSGLLVFLAVWVCAGAAMHSMRGPHAHPCESRGSCT